MPDTSLGITYPASTGHPRMWEHLQTLADDVDALLARKGYIADSSRTTVSATFTTTEALIQSVTFNAVAGVRYKVTATQGVQSTVAGDVVQVRLRWAAGASVTTSGTEITSVFPACALVSKGEVFPIMETFTPGITGQVTVGVTMVRGVGTGNCLSHGDSRMVNKILIEGV